MDLEPVSRDGLAAAVTVELREAILEGRLEPGSKLRESTLSHDLGVSRAPVREALLRVEQEGLVTASPYRGKSVVTLTPDDIDELVSLRSALERLAWSRACTRSDAKTLARLRTAVSRMQEAVGSQAYAKLVRMDIDFHDAVFRAAHHDRLYVSWTGIKWQVALYLLTRRVKSDDYHTIIVKEHAELIDVLSGHDPVEAADAVTEHIRTAHDRLKAGWHGGVSSPVAPGGHRSSASH